MRPTPRSHGISVLESCFVVAIVAMLAASAAPSLIAARAVWGLHAAAGEVRAELHHTRILAIVGNRDCRMRVTSAVTYLVECDGAGWVPVAFHEMPAGFTITANNRPEFHPYGNVGPMATISVWNGKGTRIRLVVSRSGRVRTAYGS